MDEDNTACLHDRAMRYAEFVLFSQNEFDLIALRISDTRSVREMR